MKPLKTHAALLLLTLAGSQSAHAARCGAAFLFETEPPAVLDTVDPARPLHARFWEAGAGAGNRADLGCLAGCTSASAAQCDSGGDCLSLTGISWLNASCATAGHLPQRTIFVLEQTTASTGGRWAAIDLDRNSSNAHTDLDAKAAAACGGCASELSPLVGGPGYPLITSAVLGDGDPFPDWTAYGTPIRPPFITAISPATGLSGDVVTIDGVNFEPPLDRLHVRFDAEDEAEILSATTTQIVAVVPPGTVTGGMTVCWSDECSNDVLFTSVLAAGFHDITSLAFEPGTGSVWVADRGAGGRVYEVPPEKKPVRRGSLADPVLAHPSPADGSGRIYYASSSENAASFGTIKYFESRASSLRKVRMSWTGGTRSRSSGSSVSRLAASAGSAAFLAPLAATVPARRQGPWMRSLCTGGDVSWKPRAAARWHGGGAYQEAGEGGSLLDLRWYHAKDCGRPRP